MVLGYIRPLFKYLAEQGEPLAPYLEWLGLAEEQLNQFDVQCSDERVNELFEWAAERLGDANLGLHAGKEIHLANIGLIGQMVLTCGRASQAFDLHTRYYNLMGNGTLQSYAVIGDEMLVRMQRAPGAENFSRQYHEFSLATWATLARSVAGEKYNVNRVLLPVPAPVDRSEQEAFLGCPVHYDDGEGMRVYFDRELAEIELFSDDAQLRKSLETMANQRLLAFQGQQTDRDQLLAAVKQTIAHRLMHGTPTIEQVAQDMEVPVRSLQRQLGERNRKFSGLIDLVRKQQAEAMLKDAEVSLVDTALMLGFSEQSSFQRAFKRWFDATPTEYRRQLQYQAEAG